MSTPEWQLHFRPTPAELAEAMASVGSTAFRGSARAVLIVYWLFLGLCAPLGLTFFFWVGVELAGGPGISDLPTGGLPVTFVVLALASLWIARRVHFHTSVVSAQSRFGRATAATITPDHLIIATQHSSWQTDWADVEAVTRGPKVIAVQVSAIAFALPLRAFESPVDADAAYQTMRDWVAQTR
ncbi:hypothetical protein KDD17_11485 [Sulfitobacter albidus]|uniref:YcxB family protein n=1 Tax=Sulfitobacter albidus TaxID=2829501 RepID=A0A975JC78_9RHOB|nr:hypothetical protein [Sulfitobacter albidus]QUJ75580.1 hypothetical protein KDD17_11485 [Sulfitobacter albidus]